VEAEQAVSADCQLEQLAVPFARAFAHCAGRVEQVEAVHLIDDRLEREAAAVRVAGERAGEAQAIGSRLLLNDAPRAASARLPPLQFLEQLRPLDTAFQVHDSALVVEAEHPVQAAGIDQQHVLAELLPAHGVTSPCDTDGAALHAGLRHSVGQLLGAGRPDDASDAGRVQL
jgi:hypothetical protein